MPAMDLDLLTVIVASVSCVAFCLLIPVLVVVLCKKDPPCCRCTPQRYTDDPPQYHSVVDITHTETAPSLDQTANEPQLPGRLFVIGKPSDYHLDGGLGRLPSYESVRRTDQQRHIHGMIAQHFGLDDSHDESPPSYEETFHHSQEVSPVDAVSHDSSDLRENSPVPDQTFTASS